MRPYPSAAERELVNSRARAYAAACLADSRAGLRMRAPDPGGCPMDGCPALNFGHFELQARHRRPLRNGEPVSPRRSGLRRTLGLGRAARTSRDERRTDLTWCGRAWVVEEDNLQVQISSLRRLLGADAIATLPGRGYRFTAHLAGKMPASVC